MSCSVVKHLQQPEEPTLLAKRIFKYQKYLVSVLTLNLYIRIVCFSDELATEVGDTL